MNTDSRLLPAALIIAVSLAASTSAYAQTPDEVAKIEKAMPTKAPATPAKARRLLVFSQAIGYHHASIPYAEKAFKIMGQKTGAFTADISSDPATLDPKNLSQYDAILFNNTTGDYLTTPSVRQGLLDYVRGGKGVVGIHAASDGNFDWKEFGDLIGGWFLSHPWTSKDTVTLKIDQTGNPLTTMFDGQSLEVTDEIYQFKEPYSRDKVLELISLDTNKTDMEKKGIVRTDGDFAVSWVHDYGKGRVFYTSLGHNPHIYWNPVILSHYLAGIQFAMGDLKAPSDPALAKKAGGVEVSEAELTSAMDKLNAYDFGKERGFVLIIDREIRQTNGKEERRNKLANAFAETALNEKATYAARDLALRKLGEIGSGKQVDKVAPLLTDKDERIAESARQSIALIPADSANKALLKALKESKGVARIGIINSLGSRGVEGAVDELTEIARQGEIKESIAAMTALGKIANGKAGHALLDKIRPPDAAREAWFAAMDDAASRLEKPNKKLAEKLYDRVLQLGDKSPARLAAFKGKALLQDQPEAYALKALDGTDVGIGQVAREILVRGNDPSITSQLLQRLESGDTAKKIAVVEVLGARGDKSSFDAISAIAEKSDKSNQDLQIAAISALANLGDAESVPMLLKVASTEKGRVAVAAKTTLAEMPIPEVDAEVLNAVNNSADPAEQVTAIDIIVDRKPENAIDTLSKAAASDNTKVAVAAFKAIGELGTEAALAKVLELHDGLKNSKVIKEAGRTVAMLAKKYKNSEDAVKEVLAAYNNVKSNELKASLLAVLGKLGGNEALKTIKANLMDANETLQDSAVRALADFPDATAIDSLMEISTEGKTQVQKVLAQRGVARLLSQPSPKGSQARLATAKKALEIASNEEQKKAIIGVLGEMTVPGVLPVILSYIDDPALKQEAVAALIKQAPIANQFDPGATAALLNPMSNTLPVEDWNKLEEVLTPSDSNGGSIRAYRLSEKFNEPVKTKIKAIMAKEYPAEKPEYDWKDSIWAGIDEGNDKGQIDLKMRFPKGKTAAVYLQAHVWSPADSDVKLESSSDDGMRAWVNNDQVLALDSSHSFKWWSNKTDIKLKRGWNDLLFKIGQGSGDWSFAARIVDADEKPVSGLKFSALPQGK